MKVNTAKLLNWQLSQALGLDPSQPHVIMETEECGCYSEYTRDDYTVLYVDSVQRYKEMSGGYRTSYYSITEFISDMAEQGAPDSLDGVAMARIQYEPGECRIDEEWI